MDYEEAPAPLNRKILVIDPLGQPFAAFVDDDDTCEPPVCKGGLHHLYVDEEGRKWAMRCPKSISKAEQERIIWDQPPGSAREKIAEMRDRLRNQRRNKPSRVRAEEDLL